MPTQDYPADALPHPLADQPSFEQEGPREAMHERGVNLSLRTHTKLDDHLPVDHKLSLIYRIGAGIAGAWLIVFGILGLTNAVGFADKTGEELVGLSTNGLLGVISIVAGAILLLGVVRGGNFASNLNMVMGALFILSGFVNMALLNTDANWLAFKMSNVIFSFAVGLFLLTAGMYGRVGSKLPHDNPYWRARNAEQARREQTRAGLRTV